MEASTRFAVFPFRFYLLFYFILIIFYILQLLFTLVTLFILDILSPLFLSCLSSQHVSFDLLNAHYECEINAVRIPNAMILDYCQPCSKL